VLLALAAAGPAAAAPNERPLHRFDAAGQKAAHAAVMTRADLQTPADWEGGPVKPDLSATPFCPGFRPRQADLVMIGAAESAFFHTSGIRFDTEAQVLRTRAMVARDWRRTVTDPRVPRCLTYWMRRDAKRNKVTFVSLVPLAFPRVGDGASAHRLLYDGKSRGVKLRTFVDFVALRQGRTEMLLTASGPSLSADAVLDAEVTLARALVARARAAF
jgi:hypothetical protein